MKLLPHTLIAALLGASLLLAACSPAATNVPSTATAALPPTQEILSTHPVVETSAVIGSQLDATYEDRVAGFAIDYPSSWSLADISDQARQEAVVYSVSMHSWKPAQAGTEGIPPGEAKVDVTVFKDGPGTFEEASHLRKQNMLASDPSVQILSEELLTLDSGLPAIRWQTESNFDQAVEILAVVNGYTVLVSGLGDFEQFEPVARSLRALGR